MHPSPRHSDWHYWAQSLHHHWQPLPHLAVAAEGLVLVAQNQSKQSCWDENHPANQGRQVEGLRPMAWLQLRWPEGLHIGHTSIGTLEHPLQQR